MKFLHDAWHDLKDGFKPDFTTIGALLLLLLVFVLLGVDYYQHH